MKMNPQSKDSYNFVLSKKLQIKGIAKRLVCVSLILLIIYWCYASTNFNLAKLRSGFGGIIDIVSRMLPPSLSILPDMIAPTIETVQISICGTILAILFSLPLGFFAAANITPNKLFYSVSRFLLNAARAIPDMIFALIFVAAVGLGPFPGTLAIGFSSCGMLGKFFADTIENIDSGVLEALQATGAGKMQILVYAVLPQVMPEFISLSLFRWEMNFRASTILGIVGAGGIGFELLAAMRLFNYKEMTTILIIILVIVSLVDFISSSIRKKII